MLTKMAQMAQVDTDRNTNKRSVNKRRDWFFTWNNYNSDNVAQLTQLDGKYIFQEEKGKQGTPHLQGFMIFKNARSFDSIIKKFVGIHIEKPRNVNACKNYCQKLDSRNGKIYCNEPKWLKEGQTDVNQERHPYEMDEEEYYNWKMENLPEEFKIFEAWKNWNSARVASLRMRTTPK